MQFHYNVISIHTQLLKTYKEIYHHDVLLAVTMNYETHDKI
jgi:hypothetical protein